MGLADQQCIPCRGGVPPLPQKRIDELLAQLEPGWTLNAAGHLLRAYEFRDFATAMKFANDVGDIAEEQGHHPDISIHWNKVELTLWTHKIGGLHENDFILAAKVDRLLEEPAGSGVTAG